MSGCRGIEACTGHRSSIDMGGSCMLECKIKSGDKIKHIVDNDSIAVDTHEEWVELHVRRPSEQQHHKLHLDTQLALQYHSNRSVVSRLGKQVKRQQENFKTDGKPFEQ